MSHQAVPVMLCLIEPRFLAAITWTTSFGACSLANHIYGQGTIWQIIYFTITSLFTYYLLTYLAWGRAQAPRNGVNMANMVYCTCMCSQAIPVEDVLLLSYITPARDR